MFRFLAAPAGALCALAFVAPVASATELFATTDQTKVGSGDTCLSEAAPCALGKAVDSVPGVPGGTNPNGVHTLTLLPGTYDEDDMDAGSLFSSFGMIRPDAGLIIQGKPGAPAPLVATDPGPGTVFDLTGGVLRNIRVQRTTPGVAVSGQGRAAQPGLPFDLPILLDRVTVTASSPAGTSYGVSLHGPAKASNSRFVHTSPAGSAIALSPDDGETIKLAGITATSTAATALDIAGGARTGFTSEVIVIGSILRGAVDFAGEAAEFQEPPTPGFVPGTINVHLIRDAIRLGAPTTTTKGPVILDEQGPTVTADPQLGADGAPAAGSPVIDAGIADADLGATDLLGNARTVGSAPDIGAIELQAAAPAPTPTPSGGTTPSNQIPTQLQRPTVEADLAPPTLTFTPGKRLARTKLLGKKGIGITATVNESVKTAKLQLLTQKKRKGGKLTEKILITAQLKATPADKLTFVLKGKRGQLGKGSVKAKLRLTATDAVGNTAKLERDVTIR